MYLWFRPDYFASQFNGKAGIVAMASVLRLIGRSDRHHGLRSLQVQSSHGYFAVKLNIRVESKKSEKLINAFDYLMMIPGRADRIFSAMLEATK